jgi:predicted small lipoprotein YifL
MSAGKHRPRPTAWRWALVLTLASLGACGEDEPLPLAPAAVVSADQCGGRCTEVELCAQDAQGQYGCARICANQLRCWSGCCLPLGDTGYRVCRPTNYCFAE